MPMMSQQDEKPDLAVIENAAKSVADLFLDRVSKTPDKVAFEFPDANENWHQMTWQEVDERVRRIAAGLVSLGVELEDRCAIASATSVEWALIDLGIMLAGAATTTIYPTSTVDDTLYIVTNSGSKVVFTETDAHNKILTEGRDLTECVDRGSVGIGAVGDLGTEGDVRARIAPREESGVLEHHGRPFAGAHRACGGATVEAGEDAQQGGLARPRTAEHRDELALGDLQVDPVEHRAVTENPCHAA